ncbi:unnamed protein product [Mytilus coruscus]|uniref:Uncharacterized protein n=1 Tax=Mytilus coruscus TaxID=42192 RepID=A0A6J8F236_MYTCO|nr:unnamed protein product [Mytilus coruscus]
MVKYYFAIKAVILKPRAFGTSRRLGRARSPNRISLESYNHRRDLINHRLRLLTREYQRRQNIYIYESPSWITNEDLFCSDGIHFADFGMVKYYFAIKAVILKPRAFGTSRRLGRARNLSQKEFLVVGHSFLRRLCSKFGTRPFHRSFALPSRVECVGTFNGRNLSTLIQIHQFASRSQRQIYRQHRISPFGIVLSIGSNDLDKAYFEEAVYITLLKRNFNTFNEAGVERIVLCNILPRKAPNRISLESYNQRRDLINHRLQLLTREYQRRQNIYIYESPSWITNEDLFCSDGIHFTDFVMIHQFDSRLQRQIYRQHRISPFGIVLSIGGNDLDETYFEEAVYITLLKRNFNTFNEAGVERIVLCNILPRKAPNRISLESYNQRRDLINHRLQLLTREYQRRQNIYIYESPSWITNEDLFCSDGIHFTDFVMIHQFDSRLQRQIYRQHRISPFGIVLSIGSNDLDKAYFEEAVYITLLKRNFNTFNEAGVERIVLCNILPRKAPNRISLESYNQRRDLINHRLQLLTREYQRRQNIYIYESPSWITNEDLFCSDGIHFTDFDLSQKEFLVVGHSFLRRLCSKFGTRPFHRSFALPSRVECVGTFNGRNLSTLNQIHQFASRLQRQIYRQHRISPFGIVLSIGSNDLDKAYFEEAVYITLLKRNFSTFNEAGVERIVLCNILQRKAPNRISLESYNQRRDLINHRLQLLTREYQRRQNIYIYESPSWITNEDLFCSDGIHFTDFGMVKYYFAIKAVILFKPGPLNKQEVWQSKKKAPNRISLESYNQRRDLINHRLRLLTREYQRRQNIYIYESPSWITNEDLFCSDGIHFADFGMVKYYFAIKAVILKPRAFGTSRRLGRARSSNDLDKAYFEEAVYITLLKRNFNAFNEAGVERIVLCNILPRKAPNRISLESYNQRRDLINHRLRLLTREYQRRQNIYIYESPSWITNEDLFCSDGIHFTDFDGNDLDTTYFEEAVYITLLKRILNTSNEAGVERIVLCNILQLKAPTRIRKDQPSFTLSLQWIVKRQKLPDSTKEKAASIDTITVMDKQTSETSDRIMEKSADSTKEKSIANDTITATDSKTSETSDSTKEKSAGIDIINAIDRQTSENSDSTKEKSADNLLDHEFSLFVRVLSTSKAALRISCGPPDRSPISLRRT